jgi:hypothetical protein
MEVNADRKGPKDMMDLAVKANALYDFMDTQNRLQNGEDVQDQHDQNFEHLWSVHDQDPEKLRATVAYVNNMIYKGKRVR